ncbi:chromosomal replication initiator protein DnaA [Palleronia marisminoris]|uniref:Chromosomal replication initiator protein DnaA n=1 Tax=Palleronia marisminoris TaxID=315423 RepID=A0A1Y5SRB4_9RHOB|nr:chromosomal replication initiator protein DnaA [Palleronia marisminoris]SFG94878.1 chromosomal replication initiator protein DnaA [Palleronia marisminoris]SLN46638.1 Chromosomal replication initiator protein DnaA [Palleronia marisminoris]
MTNENWGEIRQGLKKKVGHNNYVTWIEPLRFEALESGVMTFTVQSNFMGNWVDRYFREAILGEAGAHGLDVSRLRFVVRKAADDPATHDDQPQPHAPVAAAPGRPRKVAAAPKGVRPVTASDSIRLDTNQTFDTFVVGKPNELAHAAARRVADGGEVSFNPLFLYGGVGLGKTHLMHAIAWELQARDPSTKVLYISAEVFMHRFVQALREKDMIGFKELFRSVDVLMVDDIKFIAGKDSTQEEFFHTFNALVDQKKQIVLSADSAPGDIDGLEKRIVSRLNSGLVIDIHPTSYELRLGILQRKFDLFAKQFPGAYIADGVMEFLALRITQNVRELEGAMTRLFAHSSFLGREVDVPMAHEFLHDLLKEADRKVTIDEIQRTVADHYMIRMSDLLGHKRNRVYARPRQVAMYLSKGLTNRSLPEIGRKFNGRDHTTIMYGVRRVEDLMAQDATLAEDVELLRRALTTR